MGLPRRRRYPEGVRIALGATPENIRALILTQGARLAATGLAIGVALALGSGKLLQGLLFGVTPRDPLILASFSANLQHFRNTLATGSGGCLC